MRIAGRQKTLRPGTARIIAGIFLLTGIAIGFFDAPAIMRRWLQDRAPIAAVDSLLGRIETKFPYRLGLDVRGGTHLLYRADTSRVAAADRANAMDAVRDVIERRINLFGVAEPVVQVERSGEEWRLVAELAGIRDVPSAIKLIGETPFLEFREERPASERDAILEAQKKGEQPFEDPYFIPTALTGRFLKKAQLEFQNSTFQPAISLELNADGAKIFEELTRRNKGKRLAIYLDGAPISAPVVQDEITGGRAQITGNFTAASAKELAGRLNAGALEVPIALIGQQLVGASLGEASLARTIRAGMLGFLAVAIFMMLWYRLPGVMAVMALGLYAGITLMLVKLIPVTLTVAGVSGLILSIGMAVDANILIFERTREELRDGKTTQDAVREGFRRAWTSIRDSNVSSIITAAILYWFGVSIVQGFALMLIIGILVSMFSAISVTRTLMFACMSPRISRARALFFSGFRGSR